MISVCRAECPGSNPGRGVLHRNVHIRPSTTYLSVTEILRRLRQVVPVCPRIALKRGQAGASSMAACISIALSLPSVCPQRLWRGRGQEAKRLQPAADSVDDELRGRTVA